MYMIQFYIYILTTLISYYMLLHTTYGGFLKWVHPARVPATRASSTDWQLSSILAREIRGRSQVSV